MEYTLLINRRIYTINQKLREAKASTTSETGKQVLNEILSPKTDKLTKADKLKIDAEAKSRERALKLIQKNSDKYFDFYSVYQCFAR